MRILPATRQACLLVIVVALAGKLCGQVVLNEILAVNQSTNLDEEQDLSDWVEIVNAGVEAIDLAGYSLSDDPAELRKWVFPREVVPAGERRLVWCSGKDRFNYAAGTVTARPFVVPFQADLVSLDVEWRYLEGRAGREPPAAWQSPEFDDTNWKTGVSGFGFGADDVVTSVRPETSTLLLRHAFELRELPKNVILQARFDDGFVAYLNGVRVASVNFSQDEEPRFESQATRARRPQLEDRFILTPAIETLRLGENLLAIALINVRANSNDLFIAAELGVVPPVFHTSFRLGSEGEVVSLADASGVVVDQVELPSQVRDISFGRFPDGEGPFGYQGDPSPREANRGPLSAAPPLVADVAVGTPPGYYDTPLSLELRTETPGASIRYTLDLSVPSATEGELYSEPFPIDETTIVRAIAFKEAFRSSNVAARSYIFLDDVLEQPALRTEITDDPLRRLEVESAIRSVPALSIVTTEPIRAQPETRASIEFLPVDGSAGFHVEAGIRHVGGASIGMPKKMMRLYFRGRYDHPRLEYPLFRGSPYGDGAAESFDQLHLHSGAHDSVFYLGSDQQPPSSAQYLRNRWMSDMQFEMGRLSLHSRLVHLYIDGTYWGHYQITERPTSSFMASYLGGEAGEYEAVNAGNPVGGDAPAWQTMNAQRDVETLRSYLNIENFVDYHLLNFYAGNNWDWSAAHNWMAGGPSSPNRGGYRFFCWDSDIIFRNIDDNNLARVGPGNLLADLLQDSEFQVLFMDRIQRHFFHEGVLTPSRVEAVYDSRARAIRSTILAETARWQSGGEWTRDGQWETEWRRLRDEFFPQRTEVVVEQFRETGWYPRLDAPVFGLRNGVVAAGSVVYVTAATGTVYLTPDGADPRLPGGALSSDALKAPTSGVRVDESVVLSARVLDDGRWSALTEGSFLVLGPLRVTEIMYHPSGGDDLEFLELENRGDSTVDLSGVRLGGGDSIHLCGVAGAYSCGW